MCNKLDRENIDKEISNSSSLMSRSSNSTNKIIQKGWAQI